MTEIPPLPKKEHRLAHSAAAKATLKRMALAIREAREEQGLTLKQLAKIAKCSFQQISHVEQCQNFPSFAVYHALCKALNQPKPPLT